MHCYGGASGGKKENVLVNININSIPIYIYIIYIHIYCNREWGGREREFCCKYIVYHTNSTCCSRLRSDKTNERREGVS